MWQILILTSLVTYTSTTISTKENEFLKENLRTTRCEYYDSFTKFKDGVKDFFYVAADKMEKQRQKVKNALYKFMNSIFGGKKEEPTTTIAAASVATDATVPNTRSDTNPYGYILRQIKSPEAVPFVKSVAADGYKAESHVVITTDGYILTLHRILPAFSSDTFGKNGVVLLHHGLLGSSDDWIILGPKKALPYLLLDANYDVWLANARGNKYSKSDRRVPDSTFWNFSWHEIGQYDLAAVIDYIRERYLQNVQLHFIGHSMGATALLVLLSVFPQYNRMLRNAVLMAPLAFMYGVKGPLRLVTQFYDKFNLDTVQYLGDHEFKPLQMLSPKLLESCKGDKDLCHNPLVMLTNGYLELSDKKLKKRIIAQTPGGGSMKTILHFIQLIRSGKFQMFDLGPNLNLQKYAQKNPPIYRLNNVTLPVVVFNSIDDSLSTYEDIRRLLSNLPNSVLHHVVRSDNFSHTDFVWSENAHILVYNLIIDYLNQTRFFQPTF